MPRPIDLTGRTFLRLRVLGLAEPRVCGRSTRRYWLCECDCGNQTEVSTGNLTAGQAQSCGCYKKDYSVLFRTTHGRARTKIYQTYHRMIRRCTNPKDVAYRSYGAKGVSVCKRWIDSLEDFCLDMGEPPTTEHSIDRINPFGNYEPSNCRWATDAEQASNKRKSPQWKGRELAKNSV